MQFYFCKGRNVMAHDFRSPRCCSRRGFSLIELMIAVAIVAIIAAVALPSYREYVNRGNRAEARANLMEGAQFMERFYAASNQYVNTDSSTPTLPTRLNQSSPTYSITVTATVAAFTLTATPGGSMSGDKCGALVMTQTGAKLAPNASGISATDCWR